MDVHARRVPFAPLVAWAALALLAVPRLAHAEPPAPELMQRLARYAAYFEAMRTHASYTLSGTLEALDHHGRAASVKEMRARVLADGTNVTIVVQRYTEDGQDRTDDAQQKARERGQKARSGAKRQLRIPILADEQARYTFDEVEVDPVYATRVRIAFVPKVRAEDTIEGSAWVDTLTGTPMSAGFKLSKTPLFVDYVRFLVQFGASTAWGPAVSTVLVEGDGGILFFHKHFRATANLSDYTIVP
jgi:hypothetical protein